MSNRRTLLLVPTVAVAAAVGALVGLGLVHDPDGPAPTAHAPSGSPAPSPSARPRGSGVEVPEQPAGGRTPSPPAGPTRTPTPAGETGGPPTDHAAEHAADQVVPGYPARLLPAAPRATVLSSSVSPARGSVQVALVARRAQAPDALLRFYRLRLARAGFAETTVPAVGGARAAAFARGRERVVVTVDPGTDHTYSVYATLHRRA